MPAFYFLACDFIAQGLFFSCAQERNFQAVDLRLSNLFAAQSRLRRGNIILMNNIDTLNCRIVGVQRRQHAVREERLQRMLRQ